MAHSSEKRWDSQRDATGKVVGVNEAVGEVATELMRAVMKGEELFQQLQEMWTFAGGTDQAVADQLFKEQWEARGDTQASAEEVAMVADAKAACLAMHDLYEATNNVAVSADDRAGKLRRMI